VGDHVFVCSKPAIARYPSTDNPMTSRIALFPGSFDPITNGHVDLIRRAARLFDRVVVGVLVNPDKRGLFNLDERLDQIRTVCVDAGMSGQIEVEAFEGLVVDCARRVGAVAIVRGLRNAADFDYEQPMIAMNAHLAPDVDTVCLTASAGVRHISSRLVKEVAALGGTVTGMVPPIVEARLLARLAERKKG
jgi:pantetheine-phosphate adenylyltransferase